MKKMKKKNTREERSLKVHTEIQKKSIVYIYIYFFIYFKKKFKNSSILYLLLLPLF